MRDDVEETTALKSLAGMADLSSVVVADRYRLAAPLGQGSMADVYRALDLRLNRDVAIKLFHPGQDAAVRVRFAAEARALARLSHPGLIGIFDAGVTENDRPYLVIQLVDGESLRDRLLAGPLTADEVVTLGRRLAGALAHVHGSGIVHRDIKPSNIVLDEHGVPYLADFGIALLLDAARMTGSNEILGTAAYLAPEQILGDPVGAAADVYSLGLVLLECLTGVLEYPGGSKVESALARLHRPPRIPDGLPAALAGLLTDMTARAAEDRPTAADCASRLSAVRPGVAGAGRLAVLTGWIRPHVVNTGWRRVAVAGSGLAIAIVASVWMLTSLLPRVLPATTPNGGTSARHFGTTGPHTGNGNGSGGIHVAAPIVAAGPGYYSDRGSTSGTSTALNTPNTSGGQNSGLVVSSSENGPSGTATTPETTGNPAVFGPVQGGGQPPVTTPPSKSHPGHPSHPNPPWPPAT